MALLVCSQVQRCLTDVNDAALRSTSGRAPAEVSVLPVRAGPTLRQPSHTYTTHPFDSTKKKKEQEEKQTWKDAITTVVKW